MTNKEQVGIIGFGRFGQLLQKILAPQFAVSFFDSNPQLQQDGDFLPLEQLVTLPTIILCVPINAIKATLLQIAPITTATTIIDTCSVKMYPTTMMLQYLPSKPNIIATHPMFGPDSYTSNRQKSIMMHNVRGCATNFAKWCDTFRQQQLTVELMTPEEHDRITAYSQNLTHVVGCMLNKLNPQSSNIDTKGYESLLTIIKQTCNDSAELFHDMIEYNPYSQEMLEQLGNVVHSTIHGLTLKPEAKT